MFARYCSIKSSIYENILLFQGYKRISPIKIHHSTLSLSIQHDCVVSTLKTMLDFYHCFNVFISKFSKAFVLCCLCCVVMCCLCCDVLFVLCCIVCCVVLFLLRCVVLCSLCPTIIMLQHHQYRIQNSLDTQLPFLVRVLDKLSYHVFCCKVTCRPNQTISNSVKIQDEPYNV